MTVIIGSDRPPEDSMFLFFNFVPLNKDTAVAQLAQILRLFMKRHGIMFDDSLRGEYALVLIGNSLLVAASGRNKTTSLLQRRFVPAFIFLSSLFFFILADIVTKCYVRIKFN